MVGANPDPEQAPLPAPGRDGGRGLPPLFWAVTILLGVLAGSALVVLHVDRPSAAAAPAASLASGPDETWAAGARPAPAFQLRDEQGRPVSLRLFHGRPVIVTFIDPLCRNLCPVEAGILDRAESGLPASARPAILAVSVDPWGDARTNLREDDRKWHLAPEWRWAVGSIAQLRAVWHAYQIGVTVTTKTYAGVTAREITHSEIAFVVDPAGDERALYLFPFQSADLARTLRGLASTAA